MIYNVETIKVVFLQMFEIFGSTKINFCIETYINIDSCLGGFLEMFEIFGTKKTTLIVSPLYRHNRHRTVKEIHVKKSMLEHFRI